MHGCGGRPNPESEVMPVQQRMREEERAADPLPGYGREGKLIPEHAAASLDRPKTKLNRRPGLY